VLYGPAVDQVFAEEGSSGDVTWTLADNQNTIRDLAQYNAATGATAIVNHRVFSAFGQLLTETDPATGQPATVSSSFGYTGCYFDSATGLQWNVNRWYNPSIERWMGQDPIAADVNLYCYCGDGPTNAVDPSGLKIVGQLVIQNGDPATNFVRVPDNYDITNLPNYIGTVPLTANQQALVNMANGNAATEMALAQVLNATYTDVSPNSKHVVNYWAGLFGGKPFGDEETTGTGYCGAWVDFHYPLLPKPGNGLTFTKVSFSVTSGIWSYLGGGHNAIRINFGNGNVAYLDNGAVGASNIFFSGDLATNGLTNESPARPK